MAIFLQDLDQRFPIVDADGRPTDYFLRLLRGQTGDLADGLTDADAAISALQTDVTALEGRNIDTGFGLSGGGDLSADRTLALGDPALTDPAADRILFWDDSAGQMDWLTAGSGLTITDKTIDASGGGGGALVLLSSATGTGSSGVITFSSISGSYKDLIFVVQGRTSAAVVNASIAITVNGLSTAIYDVQRMFAQNTTPGYDQTLAGTSWSNQMTLPGTSATAGFVGGGEMEIIEYAGTVLHKQMFAKGRQIISATTGNAYLVHSFGQLRLSSAITSVTFTLSSGNFTTDSTIRMYGRG